MGRSRAVTPVHQPLALTRRGLLGAGVGVGAGAVGVGVAGPGGLSTSAMAAGGNPSDSGSPDCVNAWIDTLFDVTWAEGPSPTNAARMYAYCALAMYESVAPHTQTLRSLTGQLSDLGGLPRPPAGRVDLPCVVAGSVGAVAGRLFAEASASSRELLAETMTSQVAARRSTGVPAGVIRTSLEHGRRLGARLNAWIDTDGYAGTVGRAYTPPAGPDLWRPTPPNFGAAIEPYWSEVRPLVLRTAAEVAPAPPVSFSTVEGSPFWEQANLTLQTGLALTASQRRIAMFWRDNPVTSGLPSGHWMRVVRQFSAQHGLSLAETVEAYARVGVALHDAFLNCWTWKYRYRLLRPVSYVHEYIQADLPPAQQWQSFVNSPQFPEYSSGHSVASRAASTVLTDLLGERTYVDHHPAAPGGGDTRGFDSFHQAADEAAISRLYGGIHYLMGIENGKAQGDDIGALVIDRLRTRR
ncbi:vanadium-dependent haloperoxidase [Nocardioides sp.]|uniref:vanadium-dependent haloperoxidase n=1 Tax=Nocardioides sp. TaxID=35761 RepID=UPI0027340E44|nr:vanadium-dependent haloperoxidase [Nocardioides sp.]MDP3891695.1 vanadium-dependent haloperoxidase [Nocardioides sp.]